MCLQANFTLNCYKKCLRQKILEGCTRTHMYMGHKHTHKKKYFSPVPLLKKS